MDIDMNSTTKLVIAAVAGIASALNGCGGPGAQSPSVDADGGSMMKEPTAHEMPMKEPSGGGEKSSCGGH
jgi:hypothetical protein